MSISASIIFTKTIFSVVILTIQYILLRYFNKYNFINSKLLILFTFIFILTLGFPFEFSTSYAIPSHVIMPFIQKSLVTEIFNINNSSIFMYQVLLFIWAIGSIIHLGIVIFNYITISNFIKKLSNDLIEIKVHGKKINILKVKTYTSPSVIGLKKPVIILPSGFFSDEELEFIIEHEFLHVSNMDLFLKYFYEILLSFYWWNPVAYVFRNQMNQVLEIRVDELIISNSDITKKINYVETLLSASKRLISPRENTFSAFFTIRNNTLLRQRSENILTYENRQTEKVIKTSFSFFSTLFLSLIFTSSIVFEPHFISPENELGTFEISNDNAYLIKENDEYLLYVNDHYVTTINSIDSDDNIKQLKIINEEEE
ncbi:M56 family metallopeptidase [Enterococcus sp. LJL98]